MRGAQGSAREARGPEARLDEAALRRLEAYRDGELGPLGRLRVRRRLARDPEARRELERLRLAAELVREAEAEQPAPALWAGVRERLPEAPARGARTRAPLGRRGGHRGRLGGGLRGGLGWAGAAVAAAGLAAALAIVRPGGDAPTDAPLRSARSLRWIDGGSHGVMVLQDDREATIIWVLEGPAPPAGPAPGGASGEVG